MRLAATVGREIFRPVEEVFDVANDIDSTPAIFRAYGLVPGVLRAEVIGAARLQQGATRRIATSDGNHMDEEMLVFDRPREVRYRLIGLASPFSLLVREAEACWTFAPSDRGTRIDWRYEFELTTALVWPVGVAVLQLAFRPWMKRCLANLARLDAAVSRS
jgi:hypothetical protein